MSPVLPMRGVERLLDTKRWFAVRCCCQPRSIMGFVLASAPDGVRVLTVTDAIGDQHRVSLERIATCADFNGLSVVSDELAVYSDDRPIEFWRTIHGFVEVKEPVLDTLPLSLQALKGISA
jgi:hypothetical protein